MTNKTAFLVIQKDSLERLKPLCAFTTERDAQSYIGDCQKKDDKYGLSNLRYVYYTQQIMIYDQNH